MALAASPYVVFNADQWMATSAQSIGMGQSQRLGPKNASPVRPSNKKKSRSSLRKVLSRKHLQLAFA